MLRARAGLLRGANLVSHTTREVALEILVVAMILSGGLIAGYALMLLQEIANSVEAIAARLDKQ